MGFMDFFQSNRKDEGWEAIPLSESQKLADKKRMELIGKTEIFKPREIAGLTSAEQSAVNMVQQMMSKGIPGVSKAMSAVRGFMNADLSPKNIPGLSGLFQKVQELGSSLMGKTKRGLALTGNLPSASSAGTKVLGRTFQDILDRFTTAAYPFYQQFLSNKFSAPERLASLGVGDITTRTALATTVGARPRTIQQQINDAIFEAERTTRGFPYGGMPGATGVGTFPMTSSIMGEQRYAYDPGRIVQSDFNSVMDMGKGVAAIAGMFGGGAAGAAAAAGTGVPGLSYTPASKPASPAMFKPQGAQAITNAWL